MPSSVKLKVIVEVVINFGVWSSNTIPEGWWWGVSGGWIKQN